MNASEVIEKKLDRSEYMADYYQRNKSRKKEYAAEYYLQNREVINARNKAWYEDNKKKPKTWNYYRQKDILKVLSEQRRMIGDAAYHLLVEEIEKLDKEVFRK